MVEEHVSAMKGHMVYLEMLRKGEIGNKIGGKPIAIPRMKSKQNKASGQFRLVKGAHERAMKKAQHQPISGRNYLPR